MSDPTNTFQNTDRRAAYEALLIALELWPEEWIREAAEATTSSYTNLANATKHLFPGLDGTGVFTVIMQATQVELKRRGDAQEPTP